MKKERLSNGRFYWALTRLRDKRYMPGPIVSFIDYLRYEWFYPNDANEL